MAQTSMSRSTLHDILTTRIGLEPEAVEEAGPATLADLGVDSIGFIELQKAVSDEHGAELPEEAQAWSVDEILNHLNESPRRAS